jgi:hypothetical protein
MSEPKRTTGYEIRDVNFRPIVWATIAIVVVTVAVFLLMRSLFGYLAAREAMRGPQRNPLAETHARELPPEPRLQPAPIEDLRELRANEDSILNTYGWVDRNAGVVRVPVERAMELLAERGLPARGGSSEGTE